MPRVAALYRYPVKSFTPESRETLTVRDDGRIEGDRVLGFRFADTAEPDDEWSSKRGMIALMHTPGIAALRLQYDDAAQILRIEHDGKLLVEAGLDTEGRKRLCDAIAAYVLMLDESGLRDHAEHLPLRLVGDGRTPRYHDRPPGFVTMHGRGSLQALSKALGDGETNERRFRSNVVLEDIKPWEEQGWVGRELRIGDVEFRVEAPVVRCLATHANPDTGERDRQVMTTLTHSFDQEKPTFAVALVPLSTGVVHIGDEVKLL